jgi:hypothetical protein
MVVNDNIYLTIYKLLKYKNDIITNWRLRPPSPQMGDVKTQFMIKIKG